MPDAGEKVGEPALNNRLAKFTCTPAINMGGVSGANDVKQGVNTSVDSQSGERVEEFKFGPKVKWEVPQARDFNKEQGSHIVTMSELGVNSKHVRSFPIGTVGADKETSTHNILKGE